jgi:hypothetical protein
MTLALLTLALLMLILSPATAQVSTPDPLTSLPPTTQAITSASPEADAPQATQTPVDAPVVVSAPEVPDTSNSGAGGEPVGALERAYTSMLDRLTVILALLGGLAAFLGISVRNLLPVRSTLEVATWFADRTPGKTDDRLIAGLLDKLGLAVVRDAATGELIGLIEAESDEPPDEPKPPAPPSP